MLAVKSEPSFRMQILAAAVVLALMIAVRVQKWEAVVLIGAMAGVFSLELVNSAVERMCDGFNPRLHPLVKEIKDLLAGAVLVSAITSVGIGFVIFWPYRFELLQLLGI